MSAIGQRNGYTINTNLFIEFGGGMIDMLPDMEDAVETDTCTSPFLTMRIDNLLVRLYVSCISILLIDAIMPQI
jgi:hypothetical protein